MSDVSLSPRSPRSRVSAPRTNGGNTSSGGSHLKPPAPGSSCRNETPIRLAPQEDIDESPPPGRAVQFRAASSQLAGSAPLSATSCPRSPPLHRGMVRGWLLRAGSASSCFRGRGRSRHSRRGDRERGSDYCPDRRPPAASPTPLPPSSRAARAAQPGRAARPGRRAPPRGAGGPPGSPRRAALSAALLFSWAPQNPQLPRFHRPQLAPAPPRFSAMQLQGSLFPRLRIPTLPDSGRRRRAGGAGGGGGEGGGGRGGSAR